MSLGFDGRGRRSGRAHEAQPPFPPKTRQDLERQGPQEREAADLREAMDRQVAAFRSRKEAVYFLHHLQRKAPGASAEVRAAEDAVRRRFGPCEALLKIAARDELPAWQLHPPVSPAELLALARSATLADVLTMGLDLDAPGPVLGHFLDACDPATVRTALAQLDTEGRLDELDERTQGAARKRKGAAGQERLTSERALSDPYRALVEKAALAESRVAAEKGLADANYDPDLRPAHEQEFAMLHGQAASGVLPLPSELLSLRPSELVFRLSLVEPAIRRYPPADVARGFESLRVARESRAIDGVLAALGVSELGLGRMLWFRTGHATPGGSPRRRSPPRFATATTCATTKTFSWPSIGTRTAPASRGPSKSPISWAAARTTSSSRPGAASGS